MPREKINDIILEYYDPFSRIERNLIHFLTFASNVIYTTSTATQAFLLVLSQSIFFSCLQFSIFMCFVFVHIWGGCSFTVFEAASPLSRVDTHYKQLYKQITLNP